MAVSFTLHLRGKPLQRTYVSHDDWSRSPRTKFFITDEAGQVSLSNSDAANVDQAGPFGTIDVIVHAQNSVVRVLDGSLPIPVEVTQAFRVSNGDTININSEQEQQDHFRIMKRCLLSYDTVFRQFSPFNQRGRRAFPFGRASTIAQTKARVPRIDVVYPDTGRVPLAFVEPVSIGTGFPLIHLKHKDFKPDGDLETDRRLFGASDPRTDATLIPHELAHALYFALMPSLPRVATQARYLQWLGERVGAGLPPFHNTDLVTTPFIAWVESLGIFSERFFVFSRRQQSSITGAALRDSFLRDELADASLLRDMTDYFKVASLDADGNVIPALEQEDVEGAIYGALFLDFARRVGLREVVGRYLNSVRDHILQFDDFRNLITNDDRSNNTDLRDPIREVANTWNL